MLRSLFAWLLLAAALCSLTAAGCTNLFTRSQSPEEEEESAELKVDKVGDHVTVAGLHSQVIEGVGLVVNLDGTGGDPSPSFFRTMLIDDMKKHGVVQPEKTLADPSTALVLVRAVLPPAIQVGDRFDLEIIAPESANATSLAGGLLLPCSLTEQAFVPGRGRLSSLEIGRAGGPVMVTLTDGESSGSGSLRRGKVLSGGVFGGGQFKRNRPLELYLRSDFRSIRNADMMGKKIGQRFHSLQRGVKKPLAKATTDQHIELQVHPRYKQNYMRYVQVVRQIALNESSVEEHARLERLSKSLLVPHTASASALDLEAIGGDPAIAVLKEGLKSPNEEVRFYSADSLAYLGCADGAAELARAAEREEAFRVFALAALSILDQGDTHEHLRHLMDETSTAPEPVDEGIQLASATQDDQASLAATFEPVRHGAETRYGAFRALRTLDRNDAFIRGEAVNQQFLLHVLRTTGEPMVHLSRNRVQEVVLFGADQELRRPVALRAGRHIQINAPSASETVTVSRFEAGKPDRSLVVPPRVAEVIRAVGELGGSYPDVAQFLTQAKQQANLEGRLEIDALPQAGRIYYRKPADASADARPEEVPVGQKERAPNIFPTVEEGEAAAIDRLSRATPAEPVQPAQEAEEAPSEAADEIEEGAAPGQDSEGWFSRIFKNPFKSSGGAPEQSEPGE